MPETRVCKPCSDVFVEPSAWILSIKAEWRRLQNWARAMLPPFP